VADLLPGPTIRSFDRDGSQAQGARTVSLVHIVRMDLREAVLQRRDEVKASAIAAHRVEILQDVVRRSTRQPCGILGQDGSATSTVWEECRRDQGCHHFAAVGHGQGRSAASSSSNVLSGPLMQLFDRDRALFHHGVTVSHWGMTPQVD
jgi:hypothetical protein